MIDKMQNIEGFSKSIADYVSAKLNLNSNSLIKNEIFIKELKNISLLLGNAINKTPNSQAKKYKLPDIFEVLEKKQKDASETKQIDSKDSNSDNKQTFIESFSKIIPTFIQENIRKSIKQREETSSSAPSNPIVDITEFINQFKKTTKDTIKFINEKVLSSNQQETKVKPTKEENKSFLSENNSTASSSDNKRTEGPSAYSLLFKILSSITNKSKEEQNNSNSKSVLETKSEIQKVEIQNTEELSEKFSSSLKDSFKDTNSYLKKINKTVEKIPELLKDLSRAIEENGGGEGMGVENLPIGRSMLGRAGQFLKGAARGGWNLAKGAGGLARTAATGIGTWATTPIASMGTGAAAGTVAAGVVGGEIVGGQIGKAIGSNEAVSEFLYGDKDAGKEAYEKYGTGMIGFTRGAWDYAFGEGAQARRETKETEAKTAEMQKQVDLKLQKGEEFAKDKGYKNLKEFGDAVKAGKEAPIKWDSEKKSYITINKDATKQTVDTGLLNAIGTPELEKKWEKFDKVVEDGKAERKKLKEETSTQENVPLKTDNETPTNVVNEDNKNWNLSNKPESPAPLIAPAPVKEAVAAQQPIEDNDVQQKDVPTINVIKTKKNNDENSLNFSIETSKVPEITKEAITPFVKSPERTNIMGVLNGPDNQANKEIAESNEYKNVLETKEKIQNLKTEIQSKIQPIKETTSVIKEAEQESKTNVPLSNGFNNKETNNILQTIANNTGSSNTSLTNLINGFNGLAKALKESGAIAKAPIVVANDNNKIPSSNIPSKPADVQIANAGNPEIMNFRSTTIEASRFQPA